MLYLLSAALLLLPAACARRRAAPRCGRGPAVDILLDNKNFKPIDIYRNGGEAMPVTWRGCKVEDIMSRLKKRKPAAIKSEPAYHGTGQLYGSMMLGDRRNKRHWFVLDIKAPDDMVMYFDFDGSGRLDQHPALVNKGSFKKGRTASPPSSRCPGTSSSRTRLSWPLPDLVHPQLLPVGQRGLLALQPHRAQGHGGPRRRAYTAVIVDSADNDNDGVMTNDGLWLKRGQGGGPLHHGRGGRAGRAGRRQALQVPHPLRQIRRALERQGRGPGRVAVERPEPSRASSSASRRALSRGRVPSSGTTLDAWLARNTVRESSRPASSARSFLNGLMLGELGEASGLDGFHQLGARDRDDAQGGEQARLHPVEDRRRGAACSALRALPAQPEQDHHGEMQPAGLGADGLARHELGGLGLAHGLSTARRRSPGRGKGVQLQGAQRLELLVFSPRWPSRWSRG